MLIDLLLRQWQFHRLRRFDHLQSTLSLIAVRPWVPIPAVDCKELDKVNPFYCLPYPGFLHRESFH